MESGTLTVDMATSMFQAHDLDGNGFMDEVQNANKAIELPFLPLRISEKQHVEKFQQT